MKVFRSRGVLVFANSKTDWSLMPEGAQTAARLTESNFIPKVLVTTADGSGAIGVVSYEQLKEDARDAARDLADKLETVDVLGSGSDSGKTDVAEVKPNTETGTTEEPSPLPVGPLSGPREWTNSAGKTITAGVTRIDGDNIIFDMGGKEVSYPLANLSEESRKEIAQLGQ